MMRVFIGLAACLLLLQDPADKIRALVAKLGSEEITVRESAHAELLKLGTEALPAIRSHVARAENGVKVQLEAVIARIELDQKFAALLAPGRTVTLKVKDRPAAEVFAELHQQSGVPVEAYKLPESTLVSLDVERATIAQAVDLLCRNHGRLMYAWSHSRVFIRAGPYRKAACFDKGPYRFLIDRIEWLVPTGGDDREYFYLEAALIAPPGRFPLQAEIIPAEVVDDLGTKLNEDRGVPVDNDIERDAFHPGAQDPRVQLPLTWRSSQLPAKEARSLKSFRGDLRLTFALEMKRALTVKSPLSAATGAATDGPTTFELLSWKREGNRLSVDWRIVRRSTDERRLMVLKTGGRVAVHDSSGRLYEGREDGEGDYDYWSGRETTRLEQEGSTTFEIPKDVEIASMDLMEPVIEIILIPFDLGEVPLR